MINWQDHIEIEADICHGEPCIRGTRIMASIVLDDLTAGDSEEEILRQYPTLKPADARACLAHAAWLGPGGRGSPAPHARSARIELDEALPTDLAVLLRAAGRVWPW